MFAESLLSEAELKDLLKLLGTQNKPIQDILAEAKEKFGSKEFLFCKTLASLLASGLLNRPRKVAAIVLLVKNNIQKVNPFFSVLDGIFQSKDMQVETNLLVGLFSDTNVNTDIMKKSVKEIIDLYNNKPTFDTPPNPYLEMREASFRAAEEARRVTAFCTDVSNVVPENGVSCVKENTSDAFLRFEDLTEADVQGPGLRPKFLTALPQELPIGDDELGWVFPLVSDGLPFAPTPDTEETDRLYNMLMKKGSSCSLSGAEKALLIELLAARPEVMSQGNVLLDTLIGNIRNQNKEPVVQAILQLEPTNKELFTKCLELIQESSPDFDITDLEVVHAILNHYELPHNVLDPILLGFWKGLAKYKDDQSQLSAKVRLVTKFMSQIITKKQFDPRAKLDVWIAQCTPYTSISSASDLLKQLQSTH